MPEPPPLAATSQERWATTTARIARWGEALPFTTAWQLSEVVTGTTSGADVDRIVPSASTRKVAIMMTVLRAVSSGRLDLSQEVVVDDRFCDQVFTGLLQRLSLPLRLPLVDVVRLMIEVSDNLSTGHLVDLVGLDEVNRLCRDLGMTSTVHRHVLIPQLPPDHPVSATNQTSPADQVRLLGAIVDGSLDPAGSAALGCSQELCTLALDVLCGQLYQEAMPALLPGGVVVGHKTGAGWRDLADVGVLHHRKVPALVLAVFVDDIPEVLGDGSPGRNAACQHVARVARACWDTWIGTSAVP